jgi:hypothetical protein
MKSSIFWNVTQCSPLKSSVLKEHAASSFTVEDGTHNVISLCAPGRVNYTKQRTQDVSVHRYDTTGQTG